MKHDIPFEVTDYKSLKQAREALETELRYHRMGMKVEFDKAIHNTNILNLLFNGLRGIGRKEDPEVISATIQTLLGNFLSKIVGRFFSPVGRRSNWKVMLSGLFSHLFASNRETIVQRIFGLIFNRKKK